MNYVIWATCLEDDSAEIYKRVNGRGLKDELMLVYFRGGHTTVYSASQWKILNKVLRFELQEPIARAWTVKTKNVHRWYYCDLSSMRKKYNVRLRMEIAVEVTIPIVTML